MSTGPVAFDPGSATDVVLESTDGFEEGGEGEEEDNFEAKLAGRLLDSKLGGILETPYAPERLAVAELA